MEPGEKGRIERDTENENRPSPSWEETGDDPIKNSRPWFLKVLAVICLLAFIGMALPNLGILLKGLPAFLGQSRELSYQELVRSSQPAVAKIEAIPADNLFSSYSHQGTAFNIRSSGLLITNRHVVEGAREVKISFTDGRVFYSQTIKTVDGLDLAAVSIKGKNLPKLEIDDGPRPERGDALTIIGNPQGYEGVPACGPLVNYASVADDNLPVMVIQASIAPGSSGSPVLNRQGRVVGIIFAQSNNTGESGGGQALAIPLKDIKQDLLNSMP